MTLRPPSRESDLCLMVLVVVLWLLPASNQTLLPPDDVLPKLVLRCTRAPDDHQPLVPDTDDLRIVVFVVVEVLAAVPAAVAALAALAPQLVVRAPPDVCGLT